MLTKQNQNANQNCCKHMRFANIQCSNMQLRPPRWGSYSASPDPLASFKGVAS